MSKAEPPAAVKQNASRRGFVEIRCSEFAMVWAKSISSSRGGDGHRLNHSPGAWSEPANPGQDRVLDRHRHAFTGGDHLGDEEGIAPGQCMESLGLARPTFGQVTHGLDTQ